MDRNKFEEYSKLTACIGACMDGLLQAQELLVDLMCRECDIPIELKPQLLEDMNKTMGIKKL